MWKNVNAKCENLHYLWKSNSKCETNWLSKCIKYFYSKCLKIDVMCANLILTLFVKICFLFTISIKCIQKNFNQTAVCFSFLRWPWPWPLTYTEIFLENADFIPGYYHRQYCNNRLTFIRFKNMCVTFHHRLSIGQSFFGWVNTRQVSFLADSPMGYWLQLVPTTSCSHN